MKYLLPTAAAGLLLLAAQPAMASETEPSGYQLEKVVILSRHGVRAPTKMTQTMRDVTPHQWPEWPVKLGYITPRGEHLISLMGGFYRERFQQQGLLPNDTCPTPDAVYVWTDVNQRTRKTGEAFLAGLAPQCDLAIHHQQNITQADPLFHPVKAGICSMNKSQTYAAVEKQAGGPIETLNQRYQAELALMSSVLDFPKSPYCQQHNIGKLCDFSQAMPSRLNISDDGNEVQLEGAVGLSSTLAEIFLLEYAQGMPVVAWGNIHNESQWKSLLNLHNAHFNLMHRTPYIAKHQGTPLLQAISNALNPNATESKLPDISPDNKILFIAGHDTNIANIGGMLGMNWTLPGQPDNTPPGGGLVFELWQNPDNHQQYVAVKMIYQTMDQLRNSEKLDLKSNPAGIVPIEIEGCENIGTDKLCQLDTFQKRVAQVIEPACQILEHHHHHH